MRLRAACVANCRAGMAPMSSPSNSILPDVLSISLITIMDVVDLPHPDSPTRPTLSPRAIVKLMPPTGAERLFLIYAAAEELGKRARHAVTRIFLDQVVDGEEGGASFTSPRLRGEVGARLRA